MNPGPDKRPRRSIRLKGYDYAQAGAYFVTICTCDRECLFGEIAGSEMRLNEIGQIVAEEWIRAPQIRPYVELDEWVIMPNHMHGIIVIMEGGMVGATRRVAPTTTDRPTGPKSGSLGAIIGQFKSVTTKRVNALRGTPRVPVWQRNYYEHIIRNEDDLARVREYIANNPLQWGIDRNNPHHILTEALRD
jgi:REP element-mobilizing transposase RayT